MLLLLVHVVYSICIMQICWHLFLFQVYSIFFHICWSLTLLYFTLLYFTLILYFTKYFTLPYLTLPYLTLPYLTLPHLTYLPTYLLNIGLLHDSILSTRFIEAVDTTKRDNVFRAVPGTSVTSPE